MSIPKEPRQQMINLMYLVLTALLALNVSAEVLKSFELIDTGISATNETLLENNIGIMQEFNMRLANDPVKTEPFYNDAVKAQKLTQDFDAYVKQLKDKLIEESGGFDEEGAIKGKKDVDATTRIMVDQKTGLELQDKINQLRNQLLALQQLEKDDKQVLEDQLPLNTLYDKEEAARLDKPDWASYNFEKVPVIAALALLTKIQGDARTAESMVLESLFSKVDKNIFKFDKIMATTINSGDYVLAGQEQFESQIFVAATSSTQEVKVFLGEFKDDVVIRDSTGALVGQLEDFPLKDGFEEVPVENGKALFKDKPAGVGNHSRTGVIKLREPDGAGYRYLPFEFAYRSVKPGIVVSPEKMNVLYIGLQNPLAISVPGVPADKVTATVNGGGSISGSNGSFTCMVTTPGKVDVTVFAEIDGQRQNMGTQEFRVMRTPPPYAAVLGHASGPIPESYMKAATKLEARVDNFPFNLTYTIKSYEAYIEVNGSLQVIQVNGAAFPQKLIDALQKMDKGDTFYVSEIKAEGYGQTRMLPDLILKLK